MTKLPEDEEEIDAFLAAFEGCTLAKEEWTHGAHILTGACYVRELGREAAIDKMRVCVRRFNESVGGKNTETSGYHETITVMWLRLLHGLWLESQPMGKAAFARLAVERFEPQKAVFREYYGFDVVGSTEARLGWVEPDLKPLD
jgi:hypothetical protein